VLLQDPIKLRVFRLRYDFHEGKKETQQRRPDLQFLECHEVKTNPCSRKSSKRRRIYLTEKGRTMNPVKKKEMKKLLTPQQKESLPEEGTKTGKKG